MTLRTLARGSAIYAAGTMLARLGGFLLLPIYLQLMTRADYGLVALITTIVGFLGIVYRLGLDGALMRLHFDTAPERRAGLYRTLFLVTLAFAAAASVILGLAAGPFFETIFFGVEFIPYGVLALALAFVGSGDYVPAILYRATQQPGKFLAFNLGSFAVSSAFSLALVVAGLGAAGALLGQLIGGAVILVVAAVIAARLRGPVWLAEVIRPAFRFSVPIVPHQVSQWTIRLSDRWLLGLLLALPTTQRLEAIGAYSVGYQLGSVVTMATQAFNAAWQPYLYRIGETARGPRIFANVTIITIAGFFWMALALSAFAPEIVEIIANPEYALAAQVLPLIAFGAACQSVYTMLVGLIFLRRRTKQLPLITALSALVNVGLNVLLIPIFGVMGAAVTTLVAYLLSSTLTYAFARRIYPLELDAWRLAAIVILSVGGALIARVVDGPPGEIVVPGLFHGAIVLAVGGILALVVRAPLRQLRRDAARVTDEPREAVSVPTGTSAT